MKAAPLRLAAIVFVLSFAWSACEKDEADPNELGGDTNLELTQVGQKFPVLINSSGSSSSVLAALKDSISIKQNDNGIVTVRAAFGFDTAFVRALQVELGIQDIPESIQRAALDTYLKRFNATLDSTDKNNITLQTEARLKVTSEGIQEYFSSGGNLSKPFTIVKYGANVGDKYEFTNSDGIKVTRTVVSKSTTDDYQVGFWLLKVIKVDETKEDPLMEKITYITNHKYGLVGVQYKTKAGKEMKVLVYPPTL